jgi:hypothetical protein
MNIGTLNFLRLTMRCVAAATVLAGGAISIAQAAQKAGIAAPSVAEVKAIAEGDKSGEVTHRGRTSACFDLKRLTRWVVSYPCV